MNGNSHDAGGHSADKTAVEGPAASTCSPWIECSDRLPPDFERVAVYGIHLGYFVASRRNGKWRIMTPLRSSDGRQIMVEDCEEPTRWMPLYPLENEPHHRPEGDA